MTLGHWEGQVKGPIYPLKGQWGVDTHWPGSPEALRAKRKNTQPTLIGLPSDSVDTQPQQFLTAQRSPDPRSPPPGRKNTNNKQNKTKKAHPFTQKHGLGLKGMGCSDCLVCYHRIYCEDVQMYVQKTRRRRRGFAIVAWLSAHLPPSFFLLINRMGLWRSMQETQFNTGLFTMQRTGNDTSVPSTVRQAVAEHESG